MSFILPGGPVMGSFPSRITPIGNIAATVYQDGLTYLDILSEMRKWLEGPLINHINSQATDIIAQFNASTLALEDAMTKYLLGVTSDRNEFKATIAADRKAFEDRVKAREDKLAADIAKSVADIETTVAGIEADANRSEAAAELARTWAVKAQEWAEMPQAVQDGKVRALLADAASSTRQYLDGLLAVYGKQTDVADSLSRLTSLETFRGSTNTRLTTLETARDLAVNRLNSLEASRTAGLAGAMYKRSTAGVTIGAGAWNILDTPGWWQVELAALGDITWDGSYLINKAGIYEVSAAIQVDTATTLAVGVKLNNRAGENATGMLAANSSQGLAGFTCAYVSRRVKLAVGDRVRAVAFTAVNAGWTNYNTETSFFHIRFIEPVR